MLVNGSIKAWYFAYMAIFFGKQPLPQLFFFVEAYVLLYLRLPVARGLIVYLLSYVAGYAFLFVIGGIGVAFSKINIAVCGSINSFGDFY